jgi:tripartite-type tricarboxylate transporter receptor subunit TctC
MKVLLAIVAAFFMLAHPAHAEIKFDRPINIIVSFPPGGDTDVIARSVALKLSERIRQPVVVQNKSGASGIIGNHFVADSKPDGTTLLLSPSTIVTSQLIIGNNVKYDVRTDFTPIVEVSRDTVLFIAVKGSLGIRNHQDLLKSIQQGQIKSYATPGSGSPMNMVGEYYKKVTGVDIVQIPYRGNAPAIAALLSGEVPVMITSALPVLPYLADERIVVIAAASNNRSPFLPNVATLAEQGLPKADFSGWFGIFGPKDMDPKLVKELNYHFNEILKDKEIKDRMLSLAHTPGGGTPAQMNRLLQDLYKKFDTNIKQFDIKVNAQ